MAKTKPTAVSLLNDQIEIIRREAYDEGYRAAMAIVMAATKQPVATVTPPTTKKAAPTKRTAKPAPTRKRQTPKGRNAELVVEVLNEFPERTGKAADIRSAIQEHHDTEISYNSIRNALTQLEAAGKVKAGDGRTWTAIAA